jgi:hypothetical protein
VSNTPDWVNLVIAFAALVTALGVIWKGLGVRAVRFVRNEIELHEMLPWLRRFRRAAKNLTDDEEKKKP